MPLTFSHPAAAVPLARLGLPLSGLVVGSMSPDFIFFLRLTPSGAFTHTLGGLLFCLPASLAVLWIYHALVKQPLAALLPPEYREALGPEKELAWWPLPRLAALLTAILLGALTHLAWDSFTHDNPRVLELFPFLGVTALDLGFDRMPLTRLLHHASSLTGAACLILWGRRWLGQARARMPHPPLCPAGSSRPLRKRMLLVTAGSATLGLWYAWSQASPIQDYNALRHMMVQGLVVSGSVFFALVLGYSIFWNLTARTGERLLEPAKKPAVRDKFH